MNSSQLASHPIAQPDLPAAEESWLAPVALQSSWLARVAYNHCSAILRVELCSGVIYQYFHVPRQTYQDLLDAESQGAYFNRQIRNAFPWAHP